jgi:hypothetical protein
MNHQERYEDAVRRLAGCGYEVLTDELGYIVRCIADHSDASRMHNLDQLVDLTELFEWRERRMAEKSSSGVSSHPGGGGSSLAARSLQLRHTTNPSAD